MAGIKQGTMNKQRMALMPKVWQNIADGTTPLDSLTDDEVFKGRLKWSTGEGYGPRPQFYPQNFIEEQIRRGLDWASDEIRSGAREAIAVLKEIMQNKQAFDSDRLKAAMFFTDRFLGKEITKVLITAEDPVESLFRQILNDPRGLVIHEPTAEERALLH